MLTTRLTERAVINVSVADIGIQPGGGQLKLHAIQHHRPQQSLAGLGHLSQRPNKPWPFHSFQIRHTCKHVIATLVVAMNAILPPLVDLSQQHGPLRQIPRGTGSAIAPLASAGESTVAASLFIGTPTACFVHASNSAFGLVSSGLPVIPAWSLAAESSVPAASFHPHLTVICDAAPLAEHHQQSAEEPLSAVAAVAVWL